MFFPHRETLGFDARQLTPLLVTRSMVAVAQTRSFQKGEQVLAEVDGQRVSAKPLERVAGDVGRELARRRDADPRTDDAPDNDPRQIVASSPPP